MNKLTQFHRSPLKADPAAVPLPTGTIKPHYAVFGRDFYKTNAASSASTPSGDLGVIEVRV